MRKTCCILYQDQVNGRSKLTDKKTKGGLSELEIAVAIEAMSGAVHSIEKTLSRIEAKFDQLPCDEHTERIVSLEKDSDSHSAQIAEQRGHIEKIYKITREQDRDISTLRQENKGQENLSGKLWGLIGTGLGAGASLIVYFLTRG